ncbi:hypothetical protein COB52_01765 [Candidatus Kaiserbacteria bacterium]|nr:MAG: hypothetical protein COB52_01765 [Candidatus Kaiserbacteria bacterium]
MKYVYIALAVILIIISAKGVQYLESNNGTVADFECDKCNVVIIGFDALQARHVSHLGYSRQTTPTIDLLAKKGISFSHNYSVASWTVPSFMSYFTSLYPSEHKVTNKFVTFQGDTKVLSNLKKLSPDVLTIAEAFKNSGYITGGFTGDAGVHSNFGYSQGFDVYTDESVFGSIDNSSNHALNWLDQNPEKPFFMFLHGYDAHGQFSGVDENYRSKFTDKPEFEITPERQRDLREEGLAYGQILVSSSELEEWNAWYDGKIYDADQRIKKFLGGLETRGLLENTVIIVISDHGTEIGEHRRFDHGYSLYNELINVPLVITLPNKEIGEIIDVHVRSIDLVPTIFDIIGIEYTKEWKDQIRGESLLPIISGNRTENLPVFSETDYRNYTHKRSYISPDNWKYIHTMETDSGELYNLTADAEEYNNIMETEEERTKDMKAELFKHLAKMGEDIADEWPIGCLPVYADQCL